MKSGQGLLLFLAVLALAVIPADVFHTSRFVPRFKALEKERIVISNKLATAKIVSENLDHVRDLVFRNMSFPGQKDSISQESIIFDFLTSCVNDLKMRIVLVKPLRPVEEGQVTIYGYDIQVEGDFFSLGELCSKLESSQRVLALTSFEVTHQKESQMASAKGKPISAPGRRSVLIQMHLDTFRVKKK